jgi:hypothetical protein
MGTNPFPCNTNLAISEIIQTEKYAIFLRNDDIIQVQISDGVECDVEDSLKIVEAIAKVGAGKKYPLMAIYGSFDTFTKEGMEVIANHSFSLADALVTHQHWAIELIAKFYLKRYDPNRPTRIFANEEAAIDWLQSFLDKKN